MHGQAGSPGVVAHPPDARARGGASFSEPTFWPQKLPRRLGYLLTIALSDPGAVQRLPARAIEGDGDREALIACPCGAQLAVGELEPPRAV
jgi:hypothetical protein